MLLGKDIKKMLEEGHTLYGARVKLTRPTTGVGHTLITEDSSPLLYLQWMDALELGYVKEFNQDVHRQHRLIKQSSLYDRTEIVLYYYIALESFKVVDDTSGKARVVGCVPIRTLDELRKFFEATDETPVVQTY
jgi:hypothetical protein